MSSEAQKVFLVKNKHAARKVARLRAIAKSLREGHTSTVNRPELWEEMADAIEGLLLEVAYRQFCGAVGNFTGLHDRNGVKVYIGTKLSFDPVEWGGKEEFVVGWADGELDISGVPEDIDQWCTVISQPAGVL